LPAFPFRPQLFAHLQQRLATTTILLAAIRDYLFHAKDPKRASTIEQEYLRTTDLDTTEDVPKLRLNVDDNEFFTKFVVAPPDSKDRKIQPTKESHNRIKEACDIAAKHVQDILEPHKPAAHTARLLDRNYSVCAHAIGNGKIKTAKDLQNQMAEVVPSDALFEAAFSEARVSQVILARYYLRAMEQKRKGQDEPEFVPMDEENVINLEHILPENPDESVWDKIDRETAAAYYKRIGNMAIFQARKNSLIGNSAFVDKKKLLKESAFLLTSELSKYDSWGPKEINERQKELAKLAVQTWPIKI